MALVTESFKYCRLGEGLPIPYENWVLYSLSGLGIQIIFLWQVVVPIIVLRESNVVSMIFARHLLTRHENEAVVKAEQTTGFTILYVAG